MVNMALLMFVVPFAVASIETPVNGVETTRDPVFLTSAGQADSEADLQQWRDEQVHRVHVSVPLAHQQFALDSIEQEYAQRSAQIGGSASSTSNGQNLPAFLFLTSAKRCQTVAELQSWHTSQVEQIRQLVPAEYQQVGLDSIEGEYQKHASRLTQLTVANPSGATAPATPKSVEDLPVLQINAEEYTTQQELEDWRAKQAAQIERFVPTDYQQIALNSVDKEFGMRTADLNADVQQEAHVNLVSDVQASDGFTGTTKAAQFGAIVGLATIAGVAARVWKGKAGGDSNVYLLHDEQGTA